MASRIIPQQLKIYIPEWNIETEKFIDICHFEPNIRDQQSYICKCRHKDDVFNTKSKYEAHIKYKHHQRWVTAYGKQATEENKSLKDENDKKDREIKILNAKFEKENARLKRSMLECDELKQEYAESKQEHAELKEKFNKLKKERNKYKKERDELQELIDEEPRECD
jgi:hypothetical protein